MNSQLPKFSSAGNLIECIEAYFECTSKNQDGADKKTKNETNATSATIAGLALHLGFESREQFEQYESKGKFASILKRASLRVEEVYEKKLTQPSPTGAIFALKAMGWNEKAESQKNSTPVIKTLKVTIVESGPKPAGSEKEVILE